MQEERNAGLDVARSLAIIMVLVSHSALLFPEYTSKLWRLEIFGYYGVELFFVLSGFLIGKIMLTTFYPDAGENHAWYKLLTNFWLRRWYRTLPLYYLMLLLNIYFWSSAGFGDVVEVRHIDWRHFVFLQNYNPYTVAFFPESWSLAVEEWFYLSFPILIAIVAAFSSRERYYKNIAVFLLSFIILLIAARFGYVVLQDPSFDYGIRKNIFLRLDALATGVFLAYLSINQKATFSSITSSSWRWLAFFILLITSLWFWKVNWIGWDKNLAARTLMPEVVSMAFALLIAYLNEKIKTPRCFFATTSRISYSLYLIHFPLFIFLRGWNIPEGMSHILFMCIKLVAAWMIGYLIAFGIFRYFEQPILHRRPQKL